MKTLLAAISCAALLGAGAATQAAVINFNDPGLIVIDDATNVATYTESGFALSGQAATFLPLDLSLVAGIDGTAPLSLQAVGGGMFSLLSLDHAFYDLGFGAAPGILSVIGLLNGVQVASQMLTLGAQTTAAFGTAFGNLTALTFSGTTGFALDNVNVTAVAMPIPEPATVALTALGLLGVALRARRRPR